MTKANPSRGGDATPRGHTGPTTFRSASRATSEPSLRDAGRTPPPPPVSHPSVLLREDPPMLQMLRRRLDKDEQGFTLIELMVVVLIIAILIAIAIPTFLGAQNRARDRGAQSDLRNGLTAAKTLATDSAGLFQVSGVNIVAADMTATE